MHIAYCDESMDPTRSVASAVVVPDNVWRDAFDIIRDFRHSLKRRYGIPIQYELHAKDLVGGKGSPGQRVGRLGRPLGCTIFIEAIDNLNSLGTLGVYGINASLLNQNRRHPLREAVTRLFQRIENTLSHTATRHHGLVIYDGQRTQHHTMAQRILRRMQVYNPVPSMASAGFPAGSFRMIPVRQVLGDPLIRDSSEDVFLQMADIMAYALLRQDNPPTHPVSVKYGVGQAFARLPDIWFRRAAYGDPQGVVRN